MIACDVSPVAMFTKGIKAKLNELESESDIFPQNEGKVGKSELTPVVNALTNCALCRVALFHWIYGKKPYDICKHIPRFLSVLNQLNVLLSPMNIQQWYNLSAT